MGTPHFAPSAKFQLILQVFPTEVCKGFASKCPGGQIDRLQTDTLIEFRASTLLFFLKKRGFSGLIEWRGYSGLKTPLRSTQKFLRRDVDGEGGGATRPSAALAPSAPAAHRLLMRCSRAARSMSRASARSQRCCGLRPQRPLAARPSAALRPRWRLRRPLALALVCDCLEPGSPISRVCSLASPQAGRHVRFAQKLCGPWGRLILRRAQIPTNIAGIPDKLTVSFRRANAQEAKSTVYRPDTLIE